MSKALNRLAIMSSALGVDMDALINRHIKSAQNGHSKYMPHQGAKERARRIKQAQR